MDPVAVSNMQYLDMDEDLIEMYEPLKLHKAELILLPLNDNIDMEIDIMHGALINMAKSSTNLHIHFVVGTHWALLAYDWINGF